MPGIRQASSQVWVDLDALYDAFCAGLPAALQTTARELAYRLGLAPNAAIAWSQVFKHDLTLRAPVFFGRATAGADAALHRRATLAHMLGLIEAFGADRVADGQAQESAALSGVLGELRVARDEALFGVGGAEAVQYAHAQDRMTFASIAEERAIFARGEAVDFETYLRVSAGKQAVGVSASVALGRAAGLCDERVACIRAALMGVCLGLQCEDDVVDWPEDLERGGCWAALLAGGRSKPGALAEQAIGSSGVLARMLLVSSQQSTRGQLAAEQIGASELADWLRVRARDTASLAEREARFAGYVQRSRKLAGWATELFGSPG